jgi:hypothetical protein
MGDTQSSSADANDFSPTPPALRSAFAPEMSGPQSRASEGSGRDDGGKDVFDAGVRVDLSGAFSCCQRLVTRRQVRDSVLAGMSGAGSMLDSSIDASSSSSAVQGGGAERCEPPPFRRSLSSEFFAGNGAAKVGLCCCC